MRIEAKAAVALMSTSIRRTLLAGLAAIALTSCSGGDDCFFSAPPPRINSYPATAATAGHLYGYDVDAAYTCWFLPLVPVTCGGIVGVQLPAGASASGTGVSWTPAANQVNTDAQFAIATGPDICGHRATQSWTVHVYAPPVIESFTVERAFIARGESTMLTAVFHGSGRIEGIGPITSSLHIATPSLDVSTSFTLVVMNSVGAEVRQPISIEVFESLSGNAAGPKVLFTNPVNGVTGLAANAALTTIFSEHMDIATVTSATFLLKDGSNNPVHGTVTYSGQVATFVPDNSLGYVTPYTATITDGVKDLGGNSMAANYAWSFTTGLAPDTTPPTVNSTSPANEAVCVIPEDVRLLANFSEFIAWSSMNSSTFILKDGSQNPVSGVAGGTNGGMAAMFSPSIALASSMLYTATVTTGIKDLAGNTLAADYSWTFTTAAPAVGTWQPTTGSGLPGSSGHTAVWTGGEMIVWGGSYEIGSPSGLANMGRRFDPATGFWQPMTTFGAPSARIEHTAVWTGSEMIVWGGSITNTGGRYDPATDTWKPMTTSGAPSARRFHTAVWTGGEMIVWGGQDHTGFSGTGARYNPATDTWQPMAFSGAPSERLWHAAIWTGSEMIVWGGSAYSGLSNSGARYNPLTDTWQAMAFSGAPSERYGHTAVWTGSEMAVWGGRGTANVALGGGLYNPTDQTWRSMTMTCAPNMANHTAVWTGSEMIVWGGGLGNDALPLRGARYNPATDTWQLMTTSGAPSGRVEHTAVWTGSEMIVWGGTSDASGSTFRPRFGSGGRYRP